MPVLSDGPLDTADLFRASVAILRRRLGLFIAIAALPIAVAFVAAFVVGGVLAAGYTAAAAGAVGWLASPLVGAAAVLLIMGLVILAFQVKAVGMMIAGTSATVGGESPSFHGIWRASRGYLRRMAPVLVLGLLLVVMLGVSPTLAFAVGAGWSGQGGDAQVLGGLLVALLVVVAVVVAAVWVGIRLLYLQHTVALERAGSLSAFGRSWTMTRGAFWITLGRWISAVVVTVLLAVAVNLATRLFTVAAVSLDHFADSPAKAAAIVTALLPAMVLAAVAQAVIQFLTTPFLTIYSTCMYLDRRRELAATAEPEDPAKPTSGGQALAQPV